MHFNDNVQCTWVLGNSVSLKSRNSDSRTFSLLHVNFVYPFFFLHIAYCPDNITNNKAEQNVNVIFSILLAIVRNIEVSLIAFRITTTWNSKVLSSTWMLWFAAFEFFFKTKAIQPHLYTLGNLLKNFSFVRSQSNANGFLNVCIGCNAKRQLLTLVSPKVPLCCNHSMFQLRWDGI